MQNEIPDWGFDKIKVVAKARWNKVLGHVKVEGGSDAQRCVFYTSLYRCYERMINITEGGRYYSSFDHRVHEDTRPFYVDNWIWDTFRALEPLHLLLNPKMEADQLQSYVRMYEQSGWMPSFAVLWGDYACMNGNHAAGWFADAWFISVRNFDVEKAYAGLRKNPLEATLLPCATGRNARWMISMRNTVTSRRFGPTPRRPSRWCILARTDSPSPSRSARVTTTILRISSIMVGAGF